MTNIPIDKPGATSPIKKDGKLRSFFGLKPKTKPENSKQTSPTQRASQITRTPLVTSQTNNKPSPPPPIIIRPRTNIFSENVPKPTIKSELPRLLERIEKTEQLVYCNSLLLQASSPSPKITSAGEEGSNSDSCDPLQEPTLDKTQLDWLAEMKKYPMEQDHTRGLASRMVEEFIKDAIKDSTKIAEVVALGPVLHKEHYRKLLSSFIKNFDEARILDVVLLQGLVQLVQSTSPGYLVPDDLVKILSILRVRLEGTHQQSTEHPYHLTLAVSRILDVMADYKVQDLGRVQEHEPLSGVLSGLKGSLDPYLMYQACYAFQALQYVPDDETVLQAVLRHSTGVFDGLVKVAGVVKLDLGSVLEGLGDLQETLGGTIETVGSVYEGVCSLMESGRGVMDSLKEGFGSGQKRPWYAALRAAYALAQAGQLKDLNQLICEALCRRDPLFQWGICQLLGEIAVDSIWTVSVRLQAIDLLGELHKNDSDWRRDESVKEWMLTIIGHLANSSEQVVSEKAHSLLQNLQEDQDGAVKHPYPLRARLSVPASSPILARVQNIADVDYDLHRIRLQRLAEIDLPVYIPPMAKANLQAKDDDLFPLMDKMQEFLLSNRQVMLILGDSGAGKSTFNKHLESELWRSYKKGDRIPLFVNLPALDRPDRNLMMEQLKMHNFSDEQIREFKLQCKFVVICDGYDESKLAVNLHTFNLFNRPEQWNVKLVISCRSQYLSQDYRGRFVPQGGIRYDRLALELFQEAVMAPFSKEQIHNYVDQYVPLEPRKWCTQDYMDKLATIPNLMDLVKNPFLLTLALEALPGVIEGRQDLSNIRITRVQLYDTFVEHWFEVNKRRLEAGVFSREEHDILDQLLEAGFTSMGTEYSMRLSSAIFDKQDGNPVVQYVHLKDRASWKAEFFAPDPEIRFLRDSSPLARSGRLYRFLHRSILEYFFSRTIYTPCFESLDSDEFGPQADLDSTVTQSLDAEGPMFKRDLLVEPSVIQFLVERVQQHPEFEQLLLAIVELSKTDATASQAAANAFTILVRAGVRFNSADLQSIRIPWADLTEGQFDSAQFQGADLTGVTLTRSWIRQADFSNAQMDDIRLGELPYLEVERGINGCAYSPDGKMLAVALQKSDIVIYDTATWTKLHTLDAQLGLTFSSMAFSPDSEQIISGGGDGRASLWQLSMEEPLLVMEGHTKNLACVAFSPCGTQIALAGGDNTVRLWSLTTGEEDFVLDCQANSIINIAYSPTGHQFASIGWDKLVRLWNTETGEQEAVWKSPCGDAWCLAYSPDGQRIVVGHMNSPVYIWNTSTRDAGMTLTGHTDFVTNVAFSPNGLFVASSGLDSTVRLWDASAGTLLSVLTGHSYEVSGVSFSPDGRQIASVDRIGQLRLWDMSSSTSSHSHSFKIQGHTKAVKFVAYSPDGGQVLSASIDGVFYRWNALTGVPERLLSYDDTFLDASAYSPDGNHIAICRRPDPTILLWNCQTGEAGPVLKGHMKPVTSLAFSPCGHRITSAGGDKVVRVWSVQDAKPVHIFTDHIDTPSAVVFSPSGDRLASCGQDGTVRLWDLFTGRSVSVLRLAAKQVLSVAFSPNGQQLAIANQDGRIRLWSGQSEKPEVELSDGHPFGVTCAFYSPCGQWIVSCGSGEVRLWRLQSSESKKEEWSCVAVLEGCFESRTSVAWNPVVPMTFVTGSDDSSVRVWRVNVDGGDVRVCLLWDSNVNRLCVSDTVVQGALGLGATNRKLLCQRGAKDGSLLADEGRSDKSSTNE